MNGTTHWIPASGTGPAGTTFFVRLLISPGLGHDLSAADAFLEGLEKRAVVVADKGYDADPVRVLIRAQSATSNIPNRSRRNKKFRSKKAIYPERNRVEPFVNKLKQFCCIATRYDKLEPHSSP